MKTDADVALGLFNVLRAFDAKASMEASQAAALEARRDVVRVVTKETERPSLFDETDLAASLPIRFHD